MEDTNRTISLDILGTQYRFRVRNSQEEETFRRALVSIEESINRYAQMGYKSKEAVLSVALVESTVAVLKMQDRLAKAQTDEKSAEKLALLDSYLDSITAEDK